MVEGSVGPVQVGTRTVGNQVSKTDYGLRRDVTVINHYLYILLVAHSPAQAPAMLWYLPHEIQQPL